MYYYEWYWLEWLDLNKHIISLDVAISKRCNLDVTNIRNSGSRHTDRRIIKRVENALNALVKSGGNNRMALYTLKRGSIDR